MSDNVNQIRIRVAALIRREKEILMIAHHKNGDEYWLLPGGGVDFGETMKEALKREMREELDLDVEPGQMVLVIESIHPEGNRHIVNAVFECELLGGSFTVGDDPRLAGYRFCSEQELADIRFYPPFRAELLQYLRGGRPASDPYLGSRWED